MSAAKEEYFDCSFVSIHYIICECGETFPSENKLRQHLEKEHPHKRERKEFKCGVCGLIYATEAECVAHYESEHFEGNVKEEPELLDETGCEITFESQEGDKMEPEEEEYVEHEDYKEEFQEEMSHDEGGEEVTSQDEAAREVTSPDAVTRAETAEATRILVKANNNKEYPKVKPPPLKMIRDADTGQLVLVFSRARSNLRLGRPTHRLAKAEKVLRDIVCEVCGKKYASNAALRYHQRVHTGEKPYSCHLCPKAFTMPLFLQIHVRTHTGERPFQCPECPKAFSNKAALLRHERVHTGVKPYSCPMCYKAFTQSNSMKLHVATVHLKQPAPYKSKTRRMREAASRGFRQSSNKVKAFASQGGEIAKVAPSNETHSEGEFEVIISEEIQGEDGSCFEIVYDGVEE